MGWEAAPHTSPVKRSKAKHFSLFSILARERCERVPSSENSQCLTWSQLLNEVRTFFEQNPE